MRACLPVGVWLPILQLVSTHQDKGQGGFGAEFWHTSPIYTRNRHHPTIRERSSVDGVMVAGGYCEALSGSQSPHIVKAIFDIITIVSSTYAAGRFNFDPKALSSRVWVR